MGTGNHGGFGNTYGSEVRYRKGVPVPETPKTFEMAMDMLFLFYEMITRRKPSETFMIRAEYVGFGIIILLMVVANLNDVPFL